MRSKMLGGVFSSEIQVGRGFSWRRLQDCVNLSRSDGGHVVATDIDKALACEFSYPSSATDLRMFSMDFASWMRKDPISGKRVLVSELPVQIGCWKGEEVFGFSAWACRSRDSACDCSKDWLLKLSASLTATPRIFCNARINRISPWSNPSRSPS